MKQKHVNIPVFIPELACPFQCVFCNQREITGENLLPGENEIRAKIDTHLKTIKNDTKVQIAFFGGSFTGLDFNEQEKFLKISNEYFLKGKISGIRLSTRPDYIDKENLELLKKNNVSNIELGAQSLDDEVLKASGRGHTAKDVEIATKLIQDFGFKLGLQMMIGLPKDKRHKSIETANKIIQLKADETRIYPTIVVKNTALEKLHNAGNYNPLDLDEAVKLSAELYSLFNKNNVKVLRTGLYTDANISKNFIAGPVHGAFKELVLSEIWWNKFKNIKAESVSIKLIVNIRDLNHAVGYSACNKKRLLEKFNKVEFELDNSLERGDFRCI